MSLGSVRGNESVLFRVYLGGGELELDQIFVRSFVLCMARQSTTRLAFGRIDTVGCNSLSREETLWLSGPCVYIRIFPICHRYC